MFGIGLGDSTGVIFGVGGRSCSCCKIYVVVDDKDVDDSEDGAYLLSIISVVIFGISVSCSVESIDGTGVLLFVTFAIEFRVFVAVEVETSSGLVASLS